MCTEKLYMHRSQSNTSIDRSIGAGRGAREHRERGLGGWVDHEICLGGWVGHDVSKRRHSLCLGGGLVGPLISSCSCSTARTNSSLCTLEEKVRTRPY